MIIKNQKLITEKAKNHTIFSIYYTQLYNNYTLGFTEIYNFRKIIELKFVRKAKCILVIFPSIEW